VTRRRILVRKLNELKKGSLFQESKRSDEGINCEVNCCEKSGKKGKLQNKSNITRRKDHNGRTESVSRRKDCGKRKERISLQLKQCRKGQNGCADN